MLRLMSNNVWNRDKNAPAWEERGEDCSAPARAPLFVRIYEETRPDVIGMQEMTNLMTRELVSGLAAKGLNATCFTVVNDGSEAAGCVVSASEDAGSMVEVGTTIVLYIAGDVPADAPAGSEAPSDTGTPAGGDAAQGGVEYDTD